MFALFLASSALGTSHAKHVVSAMYTAICILTVPLHIRSTHSNPRDGSGLVHLHDLVCRCLGSAGP